MNQDELSKQSTLLINQLTEVKNKFIENQEILKLSIRKDIILATLKDIIKNNNDYDTLKTAIEKLINELKIIS